jgi:hypothetical protein
VLFELLAIWTGGGPAGGGNFVSTVPGRYYRVK